MDKLVLNFFGFSRLPFSKTLSSKDIYKTRSFEEALARLQFGLGHEDVILLSGPVGSGKSIVLRAMISSLDQNAFIPIYIRGTGLTESELYKSVLLGLNLSPPHFPASARRLFFAKVPELSKTPLIIIDDAQEMSDNAFHSLKAMTNFDFDSKSCVTFILAGQSELRARLRFAQFQALTQRIRIFFTMNPMTLQETCEYIDHHVRIAGKPSNIFTDNAKAEIHKQAEGIPRKVNGICYRSLVYAAVNKISLIEQNNLLLNNPTDD